MKAEYVEKQREYEEKKARAKALQLRLTCTICGAKPRTLLNCPCGTTQYCSTECQRIDWRDRGHRKACKKIRSERAAEAARAEAPTPPPSPPRDVFYGPAPRSHADEVREARYSILVAFGSGALEPVSGFAEVDFRAFSVPVTAAKVELPVRIALIRRERVVPERFFESLLRVK